VDFSFFIGVLNCKNQQKKIEQREEAKRQRELEQKEFEKFLDNLEANELSFDRNKAMDWLIENRGDGYYESKPNKIDIDKYELMDDLEAVGIIQYGGDYAKGGGVDEGFYVGQTINNDENDNPYGKMTKDIKKIISPYLNKELVIEEITIKKPHNIAKASLKSSGEKVPFDIVLNKKYIQTFAEGGGVPYKNAIEEFNNKLISHSSVIKLANHYNKTPQEIVRALQPRISTKGNRNKLTTEVYIDYTDTNSGMSVKHKEKFAEGGGVGKLDSGVYRIGKPTKIAPNLYEQKIVQIFEDGEIATASDYGKKLSDFRSQKYPIITQQQLDNQSKFADGGEISKKYFQAQEDGIIGIVSGSDAYTIEISKGDKFVTEGVQDDNNWWFVKKVDKTPTKMTQGKNFDYNKSRSMVNVDWNKLLLTFPKWENNIYAKMKEVRNK
jgi:hypothetical protein